MKTKVDKFKDSENWDRWVGLEVVKHSNRPFKSGLQKGVVMGTTINHNSNKQAFIMDDDSIVDCFQVKLID